VITILRKELADYFTSIRCFILFLLALLASAGGLLAAYQGIREASSKIGFVFLNLFTTSGANIPPLAYFIAFFVPIIGIALGFDAINSERSGGTLNRILSQPVYRDSVINGKFLAGIVTLAIMIATTLLIVAGYGLRMIGVPPTTEEIIRLFLYFVFIIIYGAFWMGLAILFSVLFRSVAISLLSPLALWIFFGNPFFNPYISFIVPAMGKSVEMLLLLMRFSPYFLFNEATMVLLFPQWRGTELLIAPETTTSYMLLNPLSLDQSILIVWPQLTALIALTLVCFAVSYVVFMRQEIRAT
jgi:ABC-2 type transport system permease protein